MNKYKIVVYAIAKNEEKHISRWYKSMCEADEIIVLDTGSEDKTVKLLKQLPKVKVYQDIINPWRFDNARNKSLSLVPEDADICICTDLDECFESGWRKSLEKNWIPGVTRASYLYNWSFDENGNPGTTFYLDKVHIRHGYKWVCPVHEVLQYDGVENKIMIPNMTLNHYQDFEKSRTSYLPLLELSLKEEPENDRNAHYLGREYMYYKEWDKAIETLHYHLALKSSTWKDERCASMRFIARSYYQKNYLDEAIFWYKKAIKEAPYLREPYTELGYLYYYEKMYEKSNQYLLEALKIKEKPKTYINEESAWNETIYDILSINYFNLEEYQKAYKYIKKAIKMNSNNERLNNNYRLIKSKNKKK